MSGDTTIAGVPINEPEVGSAAAGSAVSGAPVLVAGSDGTDVRTMATDTSGRQEVVGAASSGSAVSGNPILVGGSDGTDARSLKTDALGNLSMGQGISSSLNITAATAVKAAAGRCVRINVIVAGSAA